MHVKATVKSIKYISHTLKWLKLKPLTNIHERLEQPNFHTLLVAM